MCGDFSTILNWALRDYGGETEAVWDNVDGCLHEWDSPNKTLKHKSDETNPGKEGWYKDKGASDDRGNRFCRKCGAWRGSLGLEPTFELYVSHLCDIFDEVRRALKREGTCWVNLGDTYSTHTGKRSGQFNTSITDSRNNIFTKNRQKQQTPEKSLALIPFRFAIEMVSRGWILRNVIIWHKPNCLNGGTLLYAKTQKGVMPIKLKDLVRLKPETIKLWDGDNWNQVIAFIKNNDPQDIREIELVNGDKINCTGDHVFMVNGHKKLAKDLQLGDTLDNCVLPDNDHKTELIPDDMGWLVGLYIADGSKGDKQRCLQFSSHIKETERYAKLKLLAKKYDETCNEHITSENRKTINIYSKILKSIIDTYVAGKNCYNKHLTSKTWRRNNRFLKALLDGYLSGDGHYDNKNKRWRINFTNKNRYLANDLKTICARLNYDCRIRRHKKAYLGNIKFFKSSHFNSKNPYEIIAIRKGKKLGSYWDITLKESPNLFSTANGILIHNCMPSSAKDRFTVDFEYLFLFVKGRRYWFEQQFENYSEATFTRLNQKSFYSQTGGDKDYGKGINPNRSARKALENLKKNLAPNGRNKRCVWTVPEEPIAIFGELAKRINDFKEAHPEIDAGWLDDLVRDIYLDGLASSVWDIPTRPFPEAHFAVFPEELVETPIRAGCPELICKKCGRAREKIYRKTGNLVGMGGHGSKTAEHVGVSPTSSLLTKKVQEKEMVGHTDCGCGVGFRPGVVYDPFMGAGTTAVVARKLGRHFVGSEMNGDYVEIAEKRLEKLEAELAKGTRQLAMGV